MLHQRLVVLNLYTEEICKKLEGECAIFPYEHPDVLGSPLSSPNRNITFSRLQEKVIPDSYHFNHYDPVESSKGYIYI